MRIAARPSPKSAARSKKSRAEAMSPAPRKASPRATRAAISAAESRGPCATGCSAGSSFGPGEETAPAWSALVATGSGVVSPAETALGDAAATLLKDEPAAVTGDVTAPTADGASACSLRGKMRSRTRPARTPRCCDWNAPAPNQAAPRQIMIPAGSFTKIAISARRHAGRRGLIIPGARVRLDDRSVTRRFSNVTTPPLQQFCRQATRRGVRLDFEHAAREAIDHLRIAARGYRDQRHTLRSKEVCSVARRQLMTNERFDFVALELFDAKVRRKPVIEEVQPRTFSAGDKIRARQQHARFESMRTGRHCQRRLTKLLDLIVRKSIRIREDKNRRGWHRAAGLLPSRDGCRRVCTHPTATERLLAIEAGAAGELEHCPRRRGLPQSRGKHRRARWRVASHDNQASAA